MTNNYRSTVYGEISASFESAKLSDLCLPKEGIQTGPFGSQLHQNDYVLHGTPIITVEHLGENRIIHEDVPRVSDEDRDRLSKFLLRKGDIVFSRVGSVDRRALVSNEEEGWLFSGRCLRIRPDPEKIDPVFLSYFFGLPSFKEYIRAIAVGATMPSLNTKILSDIEIYYPERPEQEAIAYMLRSLDDKIDLNRRMNETLETMARAIFKSWFVDFDPVNAQLLQNGAYLSESLLNQFPTSFKNSSLGMAPVNWEIRTVGESFDLTMGQSPPGETYNSNGNGIPFYQGRADFGFRYPTRRIFCTQPTRFANPGDTLISVRAPVGDINMAYEKCAIGRGVAAARHKTGSRSYSYYFMMSISNIFRIFEAEGTVFGSINKNDFKAIRYISPPDKIVWLFEEMVFPLDQRIELNTIQLSTLTSLRDLMVPRLISGKLSIPDAERILKEQGM